jgi:hypothetical protein
VPYSNSVLLTKELENKGVKNELITITDAGHTPVPHMKEFMKNITLFLFGLL